MQVRIDATQQGISGFYNLGVQTAGGSVAARFRVTTAGPNVDFYSPSEVAVGNAYFLVISGVHLANTMIVPSDPDIEILGLDNSRDDRLTAIMNVIDSTNVGSNQLALQGPGGNLMLQIEVQSTLAQATRQNTDMTTKAQQQAQAIGENYPSVFLQEPTIFGAPV